MASTCPQYLSGQFNNTFYYAAIYCPTNTSVGLSSSQNLHCPTSCQNGSGCVTSFKKDEEMRTNDHTRRHEVDDGARNGLGRRCTAADTLSNLYDPTLAYSDVILDTVVIADEDIPPHTSTNVRLLLVLIHPPGLTPLLIAFGQETDAVGTIHVPATRVDRKYYTIVYGGLTYHVLLKS
jgi:hypothetical protein